MPAVGWRRAVNVPIMPMTRRNLLIGALSGTGLVAAAGAGGMVLVDHRVVPGRSALDRVLGRCDVDVPVAEPAAGALVEGAFTSTLRRAAVRFAISYPPGFAPGAALPVCLVLHGFDSNARAALDEGHYPQYVAGYVKGGGTPFALAAMDGGPGYWHPHPGDDPLGALFDEFLPVLRQRGLQTTQVGALGWSMGGYGALLCGLTAPEQVVAVAASAPAFWASYAEARRVNPAAFSSAQEWARYDVLARAGELDGTALHIDCGESDSFAPAVHALRDRLKDPSAVHLAAGCHNARFWRHAAPAQLAMIGTALGSR